MSLTPDDTPLIDGVLEELKNLTKTPRVMWMGFDNRSHLEVNRDLFDERVRAVERALKHQLCFKAVLYVQRLGLIRNAAGGAILLLGSRQIYGFLYDITGDQLNWMRLNRFDQLVAEQFPEWEADDTTG